MANYHDRLAANRSRRIQRRAGKALIHEEPEMLDLIARNKVPTMVQHCVIKVMKKLGGNDREKFLGAFNICSATFTKHGYTTGSGPQLSMTGAGVKRNRRHQREKEASAKKTRYNNIVARLWAAAIKRQRTEAKAQKQSRNAMTRLQRIKAQRGAGPK